ncbi:MAG: FRG domain-containing protein [Methylococcaceae bacterium]
MANNKVKNVTVFIRSINEIKRDRTADEQNNIVFYRGQANKDWFLVPTIYRKNEEGESYHRVEHLLYQEMLRRNPAAFAEDKTVFERLVRMQHYNLPTRLLDITRNSLVALYFACEDETQKKKDGQVYIFSEQLENIFSSHNIPEVMLSNIEEINGLELFAELLFFNASINLRGVWENKNYFINEYHQKLEKLSHLLDSFEKFFYSKRLFNFIEFYESLRDLEFNFFNYNISSFMNYGMNINEYDFAEKTINAFREGIKSAILKYRESTKMKIGIDDYLSYFLSRFLPTYFVYPPLNNERIRRQQGAFLLFSPLTPYYDYNNSKAPPIIKKFKRHSLYEPIEYIEKQSIIINAKSIDNILKELENDFGITKGYIYPELEHQAKDIMSLYPIR